MRLDDYLDDDVDERDRRSVSALFASGWFRAVLVLGVLAITLVVAVPYVLRWLAPGSPRIERQAARSSDLGPTASPAAPAASPVPAPPSPAGGTPSAVTPATGTGAATPAAPVSPAAPTASSPAPPVTADSPSRVASAPETERLVPAPPAAPERETAPVRPTAADAAPRPSAPVKTRHPATTAAEVAAPPARRGDFWVQVGAFKQERNADALARSIRADLKMPAQISRRAHAEPVAATAAPSRHEVFVADAPVGAVNAALHGHGNARAVRGGVAVQPPLELKEAVALSRRLAGEGLSVKIRRVGSAAAPTEAATATTYVVRVGGYATRAEAGAAQRALARKGVSGFVADTSVK